MEILSRSFCGVPRLVGAVAPERVVDSFLCSRLVSCTCALLSMSILTCATALKPFHSKQSYPLHHLQQGYGPNLCLCSCWILKLERLMRRRQQTPIPVEVNVPVVPELSLAELTQVWTLGVGSDRSLGRPKEGNG